MVLPRMTWQDVQQMPDDGKRREAIRSVKLRLYRRHGVSEYWIVDPEAELVEVWDLRGEEPVCRRFTDRIPARLGGEVVDEIELGEVLPRA